MSKNKKSGPSKCMACFDVCYGRRDNKPCCKDCMKVSAWTWESALWEVSYMNGHAQPPPPMDGRPS